MTTPFFFRRTAGKHRAQSGIATVVMLLLIGLTLSAATVGTIYYVNAAQAQATAVHAQTQSQIRAWTGVEVVRNYLQSLLTSDATNNTTNTKTLAAAIQSQGSVKLQLTGIDGVTAYAVAVDSATSPTTVTVDVTATSGESGDMAESSSTIRVVYSFTNSKSSASASSCGKQTSAAGVFNGDLTINGGGLNTTTATGDYSGIAVNGNLKISNAAKVKVSGCAVGDITMNGGGVTDNAYLYSQDGTITISGMDPPTNITLWGKNIALDGSQSSAKYTALKAGSYTVNVYSSGTQIGTGNVGGTLLSATATPISPPWTAGTVVPSTIGWAFITLTDGTKYVVDLSATAVDTGTGALTKAQKAATLLSGSGTLPDSLSFTATSIYGGDIGTNATNAGKVWGYNFTDGGWNGVYSEVNAAGNVTLTGGTQGSTGVLKGGGYYWVKNASCVGSSCSNMLPVGSGAIAGDVYYGTGKTLFTGTLSGLARNQLNTSPGLPGLPYCDTTTSTFNADDYSSGANYVFYFDNGVPMLRVQNVSTSSGTSIAGTYNLKTQDVRTLGGMPFLTCNWQPATASDSNCFQNETSSWTMTGLTNMPPGIALFYGDVTIAGVSGLSKLVTGFLSTGSLNLTSSGHVPIWAPNFAGASVACTGNFYPSNLCTKSGSSWSLTTWTDSDGVSHSGLPVGNMAVAVNKSLKISGWEIHGNMVVGTNVDTDGATSTIYGSVTAGVNSSGTSSSNTKITAGGLNIITKDVTADQSYIISTGCTTTSSSVTLKWARYVY